MANEYLQRTPTSTGNRKVWTFSYWIKRNKISTPKISKLHVLQKSHEEMNKVYYNEKFKNTIN